MTFINCHVHTFTIDHVPNRFLPLGLVTIMKPKAVRKPLSWIFSTLIPFSKRDLFDRYINFVEITANKSQADTLKGVRSYYPRGTKFIVLPMDMEFMGAGKVKVGLEGQMQELLGLYKSFPEEVIPFVAIDPRRKNLLDLVKRYVEEHKFRGLKMYPKCGFFPNDRRLFPIYEYAQRNHLPILTHCSRGGVHAMKIKPSMLTRPDGQKLKKTKAKKFAHHFTEPKNYDEIMTAFPDLKMCLAHFGGNVEWDKYLENAWDPHGREGQNSSWVADILDLMKKHKNLYTDISYTAFHSDRYFPLMKIFLEDERINDRILFGSDYYMVEREKRSEREMSIRVRYALGEANFERISGPNVLSFLDLEKQDAVLSVDPTLVTNPQN